MLLMHSTKRPPGPRGPLVLDAFWFGLLRRDPLSFLVETQRRYGDVVYFRSRKDRCFLLNDPEIVKDVLVTRAHRFSRIRLKASFKRLVGDSILVSDGERHLRHRRLLQPPFQRARIPEYGPVVAACAERCFETWRTRETLDLWPVFASLTMAVLGDAIFHTDMTPIVSDLVRTWMTATLRWRWFNTLPVRAQLWVDRLPTATARAYQDSRAQLDARIASLIADCRVAGAQDNDVISQLLVAQAAGEPLTDEDIRDEIIALLIAGHETTASTLVWAFYLIATHPDVQVRLHEEVDRVCGDRPPAVEDLPRLPLVEKILTETLRLYPAAWITRKAVVEDYDVGPYRIPAGSKVIISEYLLHRNPRFYSRPDSFEPDRWTADARQRLPKYAYIPFAAGAHQCIGDSFAWMELLLLIATIARSWELRLVGAANLRPVAQVTLRPSGAVIVRPVARGSRR